MDSPSRVVLGNANVVTHNRFSHLQSYNSQNLPPIHYEGAEALIPIPATLNKSNERDQPHTSEPSQLQPSVKKTV